jgi:hypothetical protein
MLIDNNVPATSFMMIYAWSRRRTCEYVTLAEACEDAIDFIMFGSEKDEPHIRLVMRDISILTADKDMQPEYTILVQK